jgi:hypothetical protein
MDCEHWARVLLSEGRGFSDNRRRLKPSWSERPGREAEDQDDYGAGDLDEDDEAPDSLERSAAGDSSSSASYRTKMRLLDEYRDGLESGADEDHLDELHGRLKDSFRRRAVAAANESLQRSARRWAGRLLQEGRRYVRHQG